MSKRLSSSNSSFLSNKGHKLNESVANTGTVVFVYLDDSELESITIPDDISSDVSDGWHRSREACLRRKTSRHRSSWHPDGSASVRPCQREKPWRAFRTSQSFSHEVPRNDRASSGRPDW